MIDREDFTPEERDEQYKALLEALRDVYSHHAGGRDESRRYEDAQSLQRIRERLLAHSKQVARPAGTQEIPRGEGSNGDSGIAHLHERGPWRHPFSTIAAVLFTALLVGSFIALISHLRQGDTGHITPASTSEPTILKHVGAISYLYMFSATAGWALTDQAILHTTKGTNYWKDVTPHGFPARSQPSVDFFNASTAWIITATSDTTTILVYFTLNAGQTWQESTIHYTSPMVGIAAVTFADLQHGWIMASLGVAAGSEGVVIFRTSDGGKTWTKAASTNPPNDITPGTLPFGGNKTGLTFLNASTGWATGTEPSNIPWLYVSHDGGQTWQQQSLRLPPGQSNSELSLQPPKFFNATDGILPVSGLSIGNNLVSGSDIYVTHDGGASWTATTLLASDASAVDFIDMQHGWMPSNASLYATSNGGQSWIKIDPIVNIKGSVQFQLLNFVSSQIGWAIAYVDNSAPDLLETVDGGHSWEKVAYTVS